MYEDKVRIDASRDRVNRRHASRRLLCPTGLNRLLNELALISIPGILMKDRRKRRI